HRSPALPVAPRNGLKRHQKTKNRTGVHACPVRVAMVGSDTSLGLSWAGWPSSRTSSVVRSRIGRLLVALLLVGLRLDSPGDGRQHFIGNGGLVQGQVVLPHRVWVAAEGHRRL